MNVDELFESETKYVSTAVILKGIIEHDGDCEIYLVGTHRDISVHLNYPRLFRKLLSAHILPRVPSGFYDPAEAHGILTEESFGEAQYSLVKITYLSVKDTVCIDG
jgi:hypothetical protein